MIGIKIDYEKRIFGFDLLRVVAIFCVIHGHGRHLLNGTLLEKFPWINLPHGVDIFFVLSGFLIGYSFIVNANKTNNRLTFINSQNFWKRSFLRILPNYYVLLIINYIFVNEGILNGSTEKFNILLFFTFTQNLFYPFYDFFWESWSLATQVWFYLLFPVILMSFGKIFKLKYSIIIISLFFLIIPIIYRISISSLEYDSFWWDVNFRKVAISRIDCIFYGVIAAWVRFYYKELWNKYAIQSFIIGFLLFLFIVYTPKEQNLTYLNIFYLSTSPIYISLWFPLIDKLKDTKSLIGRLITHISILSYAMYLINLMVIQILDKHYADMLSSQASLKYLFYWMTTIVFSYLLYILIEWPISTYGNRLLHTTRMMYKGVAKDISIVRK